jgi:hypothetical protein
MPSKPTPPPGGWLDAAEEQAEHTWAAAAAYYEPQLAELATARRDLLLRWADIADQRAEVRHRSIQQGCCATALEMLAADMRAEAKRLGGDR